MKQVLEENMSNLTSASGEASVSSGNRIEAAAQAQPVKRKRNQPGNPDPDAEVIAMSPKSLMATNRFVCDICNKGFQRDQNLQLHRRGHNLPWKLKQRTNKELVKKKVYVCPEPTCVHHDPSRALGDLTGIKKHFYRKHGEKKWKCEKCSKKYAVQSDWKAHSKTCGTREYRCDCGTLFSRRDSFVTHRAFCDALAEESSSRGQMNLQVSQFNPPWLGAGVGVSSSSSSMIFSPSSFDGNPSGANFPAYQTVVSPHMSATALLQKAAQMGATVSNKTGSSASSSSVVVPMMMMRPHQNTHVSADFGGSNNNDNTTTAGFCSSRDQQQQQRQLAVEGSSGFILHHHHHQASSSGSPHPSLLLQGMMNSLSSAHASTGFDATSFDDIAFSGILNANNKALGGCHGTGGAGGSTQGETRDFLGIKAFPHGDFLNIAGVSNYMNTSHDQQQQLQHSHSQKPWQA